MSAISTRQLRGMHPCRGKGLILLLLAVFLVAVFVAVNRDDPSKPKNNSDVLRALRTSSESGNAKPQPSKGLLAATRAKVVVEQPASEKSTAAPTTTEQPTTTVRPTTTKKPTTAAPTTAAPTTARPPEPFRFKRPLPTVQRPYNFTGFNNETGLQTGDYLVPNIVHFMRFGKDRAEIGFVDFVVIMAAYKNQRPDRLLIHTDAANFTGPYWDRLLAAPGFSNTVELVPAQLPADVFGQKFDSGYRMWHASDVIRLQIVMKYGGIMLDNDSYLVRSLDKFRRFEMALGWDQGQYLGTQVIVAHPDARFLNQWLETYRGQYKSNLWYYNAGERPTKEVLWKHPEVVHRVKLLFGVHYLIHKLYKDNEVWPGWRDNYAIHLLIRHQGKKFAEDNFMQPPTTFREMVLDVYNPNTKQARVV